MSDCAVQVYRRDKPQVEAVSYDVLDENNIVQVISKREIKRNSSLVKRLTFKPTNYKQIKSK